MLFWFAIAPHWIVFFLFPRMAKSLRSKWKRKMRAKKRERYSVKELARLKTMLEASSKGEEGANDLCEMVDAKTVVDQAAQNSQPTADDEAAMSMEVDSKATKFSRKRMTDEHGKYPEWMNQRAIRKLKSKLKVKDAKKNKKRKSR